MNGSDTQIRTRTDTHTHTHTLTHAHARAHTHTYTHRVLRRRYYALAPPEGAVDRHSGATAQIHVTLWTDVLCDSAIHFVRPHKMSFYKFWWSQELNILKESSVAWDRTCKKSDFTSRFLPRSGRINENSNVDIKTYRNKINKRSLVRK